MYQRSKEHSNKKLCDRIINNKLLLHLWDQTEASLKDSFMVAFTMRDYAEITGVSKSVSHYGFCTIFPFNDYKEYKFIIAIVLADDALDADIAHEITHIYLHAKLGYPWPWLNTKYGEQLPPQTTEITRMCRDATRIYDATVHPVIDKVLIELGIFDISIYNRMVADYLPELNSYLKSPNNLSNYILIRAIELIHRLPVLEWQKIESQYSERNSFRRLIEKINTIPLYPETLTPDLVNDYVLRMWQQFNIDPDITRTELLINSPIILT